MLLFPSNFLIKILQARVPASALNEPSFIRALATAVHEKAITGACKIYIL